VPSETMADGTEAEASPRAAGDTSSPGRISAGMHQERAPSTVASQRTTCERSILDRIGEEVTAIVLPVTICMFSVVFLVRLLMPDGTSGSTGSPSIASLVYDEGSSEHQNDSNARKFGGAILNSLVFVLVIGGMTFVLFLLFKYKFYRVIYGYMGLAGFLILAFMGGSIVLQVLQELDVPLDFLTFGFTLYNFSVVGVLLLFFWPSPFLIKQGYLVFTAICTAYWFTKIPEWTSWLLLVMMALYDLVAVLMPGGPLKVIVELAEERQESIPALVYESRPVAQGRAISDAERTESQDQNLETASSSSMDSGSNSCVNEVTRINSGRQTARRRRQRTHEEFEEGSNPDPSASHEATQPGSSPREETPLGPESGSPTGVLREDRFETETGLPDSIKLGLGDFIFYRSADAPPGLLSQGSRSPCLWIVAG